VKYYKNLQKGYDVTEEDLRNIAALKGIMTNFKEEFTRETYENFISRYRLPDNIFLMMKDKHKDFLGTWFDRFFEGSLNNSYVSFLVKFGTIHTKLNIEQEWVNSMLSYIRLWFHEKIFQSIDDDGYRKGILLSVHKMMDINMDVMNFVFCENKISSYTSIFSVRNFIVALSEKFSFMMHALMVVVLILMTMAAAILFGMDLLHLFSEHSDKVLITALGSLLIIWVLVELLHTEVQMLKGGKFKISIFIGVALIAFIRDLLIITLKHETQNPLALGFVLSSIFILGLIYWMIVRTEK
jgi:uncharacterized membrane protein (DUF373 family)